MTVSRLSNIRLQYDDGNGALANGYRLFFYASGSSTKQNTYNSSSGAVANTNPIVLTSLGEPSVEIWLTDGLTYKILLAIPGTDDPPSSSVWSEDNITGVNSSAANAASEWTNSNLTPTFVSATQFTLSGDQTSTFEVGRRIKSTVTAGTVYGTIVTSAFTVLTTATLQMDGSQVLDSGLSAVSYGFLSNYNRSIPKRTASSSGTDTYTATVGLVRYLLRDEYLIKIINPNLTTTPTINLDSAGALTIIRPDGTPVLSGDLNGEHTFRYNGTNMVVLNPSQRVSTGGGVGGLVFSYQNFT